MTPPVIGVFDSGVGGLTVLDELLRQVSGADYLYFGDTARLPYGSKSADTVAKYAISAARFLQQQGAQQLVIACNTACALAFPKIQVSVEIPSVGVIEPGADAGATASHSKCAVVIATEGTVGSHAYRDALARRNVKAIEKACPLFVPLVEEGWTNHDVTRQVARIYLDGLFNSGSADTLILGCTHYPLLKPLLREVVPASVRIIDSAEATATVVRAKVRTDGSRRHTDVRFFATDSIDKFRRSGEKFLSRDIKDVAHVDLES